MTLSFYSENVFLKSGWFINCLCGTVSSSKVSIDISDIMFCDQPFVCHQVKINRKIIINSGWG